LRGRSIQRSATIVAVRRKERKRPEWRERSREGIGGLLAGALEGVGDLADGEAVVVGVGDVDAAVQGDALAAHALEGDAVERRLRLGDVRDLVRHEPLGLVHQALLLLRLRVLARHGSALLFDSFLDRGVGGGGEPRQDGWEISVGGGKWWPRLYQAEQDPGHAHGGRPAAWAPRAGPRGIRTGRVGSLPSGYVRLCDIPRRCLMSREGWVRSFGVP
jgi:hypothetical protein